MMKLLICLSLILIPLISVVEGSLLGSKKLIKDVSDPNVVAAAEYAITEYNSKQSKEKNLVFERVVKGTEQLVSGTKYDLVIAAKTGGASKNYEAVVVVKAWDNSKILESFKAV